MNHCGQRPYDRLGYEIIADRLQHDDLTELERLLQATGLIGSTDPGDGYGIDAGFYQASDELRDHVRRLGLDRLASDALGGPSAFVTDRYFTVRARSRSRTVWHQDTPLSGRGVEVCVVWIPLTDVTEQRAPLVVADDTHLDRTPVFARSMERSIVAFERREGHPCTVVGDELDAFPRRTVITARRGDVILLHGWTVHACGPNLDDVDRHAYQLRFGLTGPVDHPSRACEDGP